MFKLKHVALAVLAAGYVTAPLAMEAVTKGLIQGSKPILKAPGKNVDKTVRFNTEKANGSAHTSTDRLSVGDKMILEYNLTDVDGDPEGEANNSAAGILFYYRDATTNAWVAFDAATRVISSSQNPSIVKMTIPKGAKGSKTYGYKILEKTEFGYPAGDIWYKVPDAFDQNKVDLGTGANTDPSNPGSPSDPDVGGNGSDIGTNVIKPGIDPDCDPFVDDDCGTAPGDDYSVKIHPVENGVVNTAIDYTAVEDRLTVGQTYAAIVYDENGDADTAAYRYAWSLKGINTPAGGTDDLTTPVAIADATSDKYTIGINSTTGLSGYAAGAQGFILRVQAN